MLPEQRMLVIERFVILIYDYTSTCTNMNKARKKLFAKTSSVKRIPPSHVVWSCLPRWSCLGESTYFTPCASFSNQLGLVMTDGGLYEPHWTTLQEASKTCYELISCGCKKRCRTRCKCKKAGLQCTALCKCEGECPAN